MPLIVTAPVGAAFCGVSGVLSVSSVGVASVTVSLTVASSVARLSSVIVSASVYVICEASPSLVIASPICLVSSTIRPNASFVSGEVRSVEADITSFTLLVAVAISLEIAVTDDACEGESSETAFSIAVVMKSFDVKSAMPTLATVSATAAAAISAASAPVTPDCCKAVEILRTTVDTC